MKLAALMLIPSLALALLVAARRVLRNRDEIRHRLQRCGQRKQVFLGTRRSRSSPPASAHTQTQTHSRASSGQVEPELLRMLVELGVLVLLLGWLSAHEPRW